MNNIEAIMKMKKAWDVFRGNHPKFPQFLSAVRRAGIKEGTIIDICITDPSGAKMETNIKVTESDLELYESLKNMSPQG